MKKWGFLLFLVVCLGFSMVNIDAFFQEGVEINPLNQKVKELFDKEPSGDFEWKVINEEQIYQGNLLLVNKDYPVHRDSTKKDIINLLAHQELTRGFGINSGEMYLSKSIVQKFSEMIEAAKKDGVCDFLINSGFRDFAEQSALFEEMGANYALPAGNSEHNLGLSLDVGSTQTRMSEAPEGKWMEKNVWRYGFILRYPKDKTEVTGIQFEPWHIRYVGLPHSAIMHKKNLVLEEYLDYLKKKVSITAIVNREKYKISYYPISKSTKVKVPENQKYEISGNNMDGVIVTVFEK